ncbi:hypothetical protein Tco_1375036, partial [Tanacetum coccineum]
DWNALQDLFCSFSPLNIDFCGLGSGVGVDTAYPRPIVVSWSRDHAQILSQRAVICNMQPGVLPTSLPASHDQVNPVATRLRFNIDEADGNVRKVYDKHAGISEEYYNHGDPIFEWKDCHALTYHSMGSLLPKEVALLKFAQLNSLSSFAPSKLKNHVDRDIIRQLKDVLDTSSDLVKIFRIARDRYTEGSEHNIRIKLVAKRGTDGRTYNLPTANKVAGLIVGDFNSCVEQRDIVIEIHYEGLERINIFHPLYLPLQYPLLMSCG